VLITVWLIRIRRQLRDTTTGAERTVLRMVDQDR
jgi:hypothetical protein